MASSSPQERLLERWVRLILKYRLLVLGVSVVITGAFAAFLVTLPMVTAVTDYIPSDTKGMREWREARERYGGDEVAFFALEADDHFTRAGLDRLDGLVQRVEAHPFVDRVISISNAQQMRGDPDDPETLLIDGYLREDLAPKDVLAAVRGDRLMRETVSADGRVIIIAVKLVSSRDDIAAEPEVAAEVSRRTRDLPGAAMMARHPGGNASLLDMSKQGFVTDLTGWLVEAGYAADRVHGVGFPVVLAVMIEDSKRNLRVLFPVTMVIIALVLFVLLRNPVDAIIPLLCVGPAVVWACGLGGVVFGRITITTSVAPIMVLVVGVSDVVHLVTQYRHDLARGLTRDDAIIQAFRHVGAACVLTSVTTLIGFGSMALLPLPMSQELGVFAAMGVVAAFVLAFVLTPIVLSYTKLPPRDVSELAGNDWVASCLAKVAPALRRRPRAVVAAGWGLTAVVLAALPHVTIENDFMKKLGPDNPLHEAVRVIDGDGDRGGSNEIELLIDAGSPDGFKDPALIAGLARLQAAIEEDAQVAQTTSLTDTLQWIHEIITGVDGLPDTRAAIAQYLLLFDVSGGEGLDALIDDTGQHGRVLVRLNATTAESLNVLGDEIEDMARRWLPESTKMSVNGISMLAARLAPAMLESSFRGFFTAYVLIAILLGILFRSVRVGVLSLIPNILPVAFGVICVYLVHGIVDSDTLAFIAVAIGIAVDDTIHFLARYRIERRKGLDRSAATEATVIEAGHGIMRTTIVLVAGFSAMIFSDYVPVSAVGIMLPVSMATAVFLDLTLVPAMAELGLLEPRL